MPRFPTSAGMSLPQIGLEESRQTEDRKARKAAMRQALLNTGIGAGFQAANTGLRAMDTFSDMGARRRAEAMQEKRLGLEFPEMEGKPYRAYQAETERRQADKDPVAAIVAASRFGSGEAARTSPFVRSPQEAEAAAQAAMAGAPQGALEFAEKTIAPYGQSLQIGAFHETDQDVKREKLALVVGALLKEGVDPQVIQVAIQQLQQVPGGIPGPRQIDDLGKRKARDPAELLGALGAGLGDIPNVLLGRGALRSRAWSNEPRATEALLSRLRSQPQGTGEPPLPPEPLSEIEVEFLKRRLQKQAP